MAPWARSVEQVVNLALARIGVEERIADIFEGSVAAQLVLDIYGQTRDELLRQGQWGFAQRNVSLTLLKSAPAGGYVPPTVWSSAYPPLPWLYEYAYPTDCLKIRAIKPSPILLPNFDPQPFVWSVENDGSYDPPVKVILSNVGSAVMVYTGQITDPTTWEADFVEALADALARRMAASSAKLKANLESEKFELADEQQAKAIGEAIEG